MKTALTAFIRNFRKRKVIYSITLLGFGIALAVFVLITSFLIEEKSYDKHLPYLSKMYRVKYGDRSTGVPRRYYDRLKEKVPEIEKVGMYNRNGISFKYQEKPHNAQYLGISEECIDLFNITFLQGSKEAVMDSKTGIAITESYCKKIFGDKNPLGEEIEVNNEKRVISAIVNDPLRTFSVKYDFLWHNDLNTNMSFYCWGSGVDDCYRLLETAFVLNEKTNISDLEQKLNEVLSDCRIYQNEKIHLQKYEEIYFDREATWDGHDKANTEIIRLLTIVACIILVLAILNYINLSTAANKERFKEVCVRKTSGARNISIVRQFINESYITCLISLGIGFLVLIFFSTSFNEIFGKEFNVFDSFGNKTVILALVLILIIVGGISGLVPAVTASMFTPIKLLQHKSNMKRSGARGAFNAIQFLISISLIISLILINKQIKYVKTADFGFKTDQLLMFRLADLDNHVQAIREKLNQNPNIYQACASEDVPFNLKWSGSNTVKANGEEFSSGQMRFLNTDWNFLNTFDIPLLIGRDFRQTDKNVCMINETFYKEMGWKNLEDKYLDEDQIIGVIKDIHYEELHKKIGKLSLKLVKNEPDHDLISVKINGSNMTETIAYIKSVMKSFDPHFELNYEFYDALIDKLYRQEEKQAKAIKIFAFIAILLSCLGLYGMVEFSCSSQIKEIGIRKVNGAKISEIFPILIKEFFQWIIIAYIIAVPISRVIISHWLEGFAYKTAISWWVFALTGIITFFIALVTVSWQSWMAARRNPVEALRYE